MVNFKRITALLIIMALIAVCPSFASSKVNVENDWLKLSAFGIVSGEEPGLNVGISRGEFISMAVEMSFIDEKTFENYEITLPFSDVKPEDANYPYIKAAYIMGWISGTAGAAVEADAEITAEQATKILVNLLGFSEKAMATGGYPTGYIMTAKELDIFKGAAISNTAEPLSKAAACKMISNALEANFADVKKVGEAVVYQVSQKPYMSEMHDIYKVKGIVTQNEYTSIYGPAEIAKNKIELCGLLLDAGKTDAKEYIGYYVNCYYKDNDGNYEILYIEADDNNNILEISSEDIASGTSVSKVVYTIDNDQLKEARLSDTVSVIANEVMKAISKEILCPKYGKLILIDNNGDKIYDVVKAYDYRTVVISSIALTARTISDELGGTPIKLDEGKFESYIELNSEKSELEKLAVNDVVLYFEINGEGVKEQRLYVSRNSVNGSITLIGEDFIAVGGMEYDVSDKMMETLSAGDAGTFYTDIYGRIVFAEISDESYAIGLITNIKKDNFDVVTAKIFTENNRWVTLNFKDSIILNGNKTSAVKYCSDFDGRQLIQYRVNSDAMITAITKAVDCTLDKDVAKEALENDSFRLSDKMDNSIFRNYLKSFDNRVSLSPDTKIFFAPLNDVSDEKSYYIGSLSNLSYNNSYKSVYAYNADKTRVTDLVVIYTEGASINSADNVADFLLVDKIGERLVGNEVLPCITGMYGKYGEVEIYVTDDSVLSEVGGIEKGDVIQLGFNNDGIASKINKVFDLSGGLKNQSIKNSLYSDSTLLSGTVDAVNMGRMRITVNYGTTDSALLGLDSYLKVVYIYNLNTNKVITAAPQDIMEGDFIVGGFRQYQAQAMIVYRK